ncbi:MAG: hypothetical protein KBC64_00285 [Simkaniaceae bacterium]|nr:hypothetical protein [Simkaniaceae bacterium]
MDKFVSWNAREVKQLNPLAIASFPFAQLAKLINKLILPLLAQAIFAHAGTSEALKLKMGAYLSARPNANLAAIFAQFDRETQDDTDLAIYEARQAAGDDVSNPIFGQDFRLANPQHADVKAAMIKACNDRYNNIRA